MQKSFYRLLNENFDELYQRSKYQNIQKSKTHWKPGDSY